MKRLYTILIAAFASCLVTFGQEIPDSLIVFPWNETLTDAQTTGGMTKVGEKQLETKVLGDLRNKLTGLFNGVEIRETGGSYFSPSTSDQTNYNIGNASYDVNIKGFGGARFIVDDVTIPFNQLLLEPNQIESVTVISDVLDKAKYGPMASYGAVYIKTKKGGYNTPLSVTVDVEGGLNMVDKVPEWVSGAEYATLNNAARQAALYPTLYSEEAIAAFGQYNANDSYYPCVNYKSLMMKDTFWAERVSFRATAGSSNIKYNISVNALHSDDFKVSSTTQDYNKLNASANVSARIGRFVEMTAGFNGLLSYRDDNRISWYNYRTNPECAFPLILGKTTAESEGLESGRTIYGVSKTWENNYYAKMLEGGYYQNTTRSGMFYANLDIDLGFIAKGLKSKTFIETSSMISRNLGKTNDYIAYYWDPDLGIGEISSHTGKLQTGRSTGTVVTSQTLSMYQRFYYDLVKNGHKLNAGLTYYMYSGIQSGDSARQRQQFFTGNVAYSYKDRYAVEAVAQYAGSSRFKKGSRFGFFPSVGLAWTISNESWMKDAKAVDKLKLRAQIGKVGSADVFASEYLYQANYALASGMYFGPATYSPQWFGNNTRLSQKTTVSRLANPGLTWNYIDQIDLGLDADLFGCLHIGASAYTWKFGGMITDVLSVLPELYGLGSTVVYDNYEEETSAGYDVNVAFHKQWGDFGVRVGADVYNWSRVYSKLVKDEYTEEYQKKTGTSTYAIWGLECTGKYQSQEEIDNNPSYVAKTDIQIGDLMYKDQNGDGNIDTNDRVIIGSSSPKLRYSVNLGFSWKDLDLQVIGTGRVGGDLQFTGDYFWQGWGDGNYSAFVRDNIGGEYPRLSYVKSTNNFVLSNFWLRDGSWFKIQSAEIGYNLKFKKPGALKSIRFTVKGDNLYTFTKVKYVDPEAISTGITSMPLFRVVSLGAKFNF